MKPKCPDTREAWLRAAVEWLRPHFSATGAMIPAAVHVSIGFPSRGATSLKNRVLGQCWDTKASADGIHHVFISPTLMDAVQVSETLVHELVHAAVGTEEGHKGAFKRTAVAMGLEGRMKSTHAGEKLRAVIGTMIEEIGPLAHPALSPAVGIKKQGTRMLKAECAGCGMVVRTTQVWVDTIGLPSCRCGSDFELATCGKGVK